MIPFVPPRGIREWLAFAWHVVCQEWVAVAVVAAILGMGASVCAAVLR